ncbi:L,D-transpeptidase [Candidatus Woesebacteria bacterium]|nr:L,D-transpeptidase [Candidatus Woesebacteria bacterium]
MASRKNFLIVLSSAALILIVFVLGSGRMGEGLGTAEGYNSDLSGNIYQDEKYAFYQGQNIEVPEAVVSKDLIQPVLGAVSDAKWIEVDLSEQKLRAWEGGSLFLETLISSGLPGTPTPKGEFRIWIKLRATKMEGGSGSHYYYLPNVPYVMYFENEKVAGWRGYGLHGTYWHNDFGRPKSHGCVNLPTPMAQRLYEWTTPVLVNGKNMVRSSSNNPGTRIVIHD